MFVPTKKQIGVAVAVVVIVSLACALMPHLIEWFIGGSLAGGAALAGAQKKRRSADREHRNAIKVETTKVDELTKEAQDRNNAAEVRSDSDPQNGASGLTVNERIDRLEKAAGRIK